MDTLRNDWLQYAIGPDQPGRRMATTQDETIDRLQCPNLELRQDRDGLVRP
jgi:hypothetical protein